MNPAREPLLLGAGLVTVLACSEPKPPSPSPESAGGATTFVPDTIASSAGATAGGSEQQSSQGQGGAAGAPAAECPEPAPSASGDGPACSARSAAFATAVVDHAFGDGQATGQDSFPDPVLGPPHGAGCCQGAVESVVSLGNGGWLVLEFEDNAIVDGPGPDFIVFENAFYPGGVEERVFAELATVAVSEDGRRWLEFPCTATSAPFGQCAGWRPTLANAEENTIDPTDPLLAGGNAFDLADVCLDRARFVRITDRVDLDDALDGVFDLDAVAIVHALCPTVSP